MGVLDRIVPTPYRRLICPSPSCNGTPAPKRWTVGALREAPSCGVDRFGRNRWTQMEPVNPLCVSAPLRESRRSCQVRDQASSDSISTALSAPATAMVILRLEECAPRRDIEHLRRGTGSDASLPRPGKTTPNLPTYPRPLGLPTDRTRKSVRPEEVPVGAQCDRSKSLRPKGVPRDGSTVDGTRVTNPLERRGTSPVRSGWRWRR